MYTLKDIFHEEQKMGLIAGKWKGGKINRCPCSAATDSNMRSFTSGSSDCGVELAHRE